MTEYIDREALIVKMRAMPIPKQAGSGYTWLDNCAAGINSAIQEVKLFPSADVAPVRHGRWGDNGIPGSMLSGCSVCGFTCGAYTFRFCPNCGAEMDLEAQHD